MESLNFYYSLGIDQMFKLQSSEWKNGDNYFINSRSSDFKCCILGLITDMMSAKSCSYDL